MKTSSKKQFRFYTQEEKAFLAPFVNQPNGSKLLTPAMIAFCKKNNRSERSVYQYINNERNKLKKAGVVQDTQKNLDTTVLRKNEFVIPINNWEIRTENGQPQLVLKFK